MRRSQKRRARAGHFDTRVIFYVQDSNATANNDGEIPETPLEVCRRWAEVIPLRGRLQPLQASLEANISHVVRVHYDPTVEALTPENWIVTDQGSLRLNISSLIDLDNLHHVIEIECTERK